MPISWAASSADGEQVERPLAIAAAAAVEQDPGELEPGPRGERPVSHALAQRQGVGEVALGDVEAAVGRREQAEHPRRPARSWRPRARR